MSYDTLLSIYSISYQQMVIKTSHTHRDAMPRYYQEYAPRARARSPGRERGQRPTHHAGTPARRHGRAVVRYKAARTASGDAVGQAILLQLAERVNMPPCILARHILRFHFNEHHRASPQVAQRRRVVMVGSPRGGLGSPAVRAHTADWTEAAVKAEINKIMKEPDALPDVVLRQEIVDCIVGDLQYSPDMILAKQLIGHEYELRLRLHLSNCGIPFMGTRTAIVPAPRSLGHWLTRDSRV